MIDSNLQTARNYFKYVVKKLWREENRTDCGILYLFILIIEGNDLEEIQFCIDNGVDMNGSIPENHLNLLKDLQYDIPTTTVSSYTCIRFWNGKWRTNASVDFCFSKFKLQLSCFALALSFITNLHRNPLT